MPDPASDKMRGGLRATLRSGFAVLAVTAAIGIAHGQGMPGQGPRSGLPGGGGPVGGPGDTLSSNPDKPDAAARKAFTAGVKSLNKAKEFEAAAAAAANPDKKAKEMEKMGDAYNKALDQFTEALSNKGDMFDAWNNVGFVHLRLGAFAESVDDYNHALALKSDALDAVERRAEALLALDHLDDAKAAYMDLFNHDRSLADRLMVGMQQWRVRHRADAGGVRAADIDAFDQWLQEREGIVKQAASIPH